MEKKELNSDYVAFSLILGVLLIVVMLTYLQIKLEETDKKIINVEKTIDSLTLIKTYPYEHSEIRNDTLR